MKIQTLLFTLSLIVGFISWQGTAQAIDLSTSGNTPPCTHTAERSYFTHLGVLTFVNDPVGRNIRWICQNNKVLLEVRADSKGSHDSFNWQTGFEGAGSEYIAAENRDGKYGNKKSAHLLNRLIVVDDAGFNYGTQYWLLDFRGMPQS